ncbi:MAG: tagatose 1,6-diphosphate aldolase [Pelolinea sp.]|nr:tagatose 1,6-diphosphate aldolase [Pelolinea sp.]
MITIGKALGISNCASKEGVFNVLAFDHRNNLRKQLNPSQPESITYEMLTELKAQIVQSLIDSSSALLLDPEYGLNHEVIKSIISCKSGIILAIEETGYSGISTERVSRVLENWSVEKAKRIGANAVKLLIYYHPLSKTAAVQEETVRLISEQCVQYDIPLFLEILTHSIDPQKKQLSSDEKKQTIIAAVEKFNSMPIDLYKLEFPLNFNEELSESEWETACKAVSNAVRIPWLLLSAGVDFETFVRQSQIACRSGASGVMAGRAIWKEALELEGGEKDEFLKHTAPARMQRIAQVCEQTAKPWTDYFRLPELGENWYGRYKGFI